MKGVTKMFKSLKTHAKRFISFTVALVMVVGLIGFNHIEVAASGHNCGGNGDCSPRQFQQSVSISDRTVTLTMRWQLAGRTHADRIYWYVRPERGSSFIVFPTNSPNHVTSGTVTLNAGITPNTVDYINRVTRHGNSSNGTGAFRNNVTYRVQFTLPSDLAGQNIMVRARAVNARGTGMWGGRVLNNNADSPVNHNCSFAGHFQGNWVYCREPWGLFNNVQARSTAQRGTSNINYISAMSRVLVNEIEINGRRDPVPLVFDGRNQGPYVSVTNVRHPSGVLRENRDYRVTRPNMTNAGRHRITLTGMGYFSGSITRYITMNRAYITTPALTPVQPLEFRNERIEPAITLRHGTRNLVRGTDFNVSYSNNINAGSAGFTITGINNYQGTRTGSFTINRFRLDNPANRANITIEGDTTFTTNPITPRIRVEVPELGMVLREGTDFVVDGFVSNTDAGNAHVTISGIGNFQGTITRQFPIQPRPLADVSFTPIPDAVFDGNPHAPTVTASFNGEPLQSPRDFIVTNVTSASMSEIISPMTVADNEEYTECHATTEYIPDDNVVVSNMSVSTPSALSALMPGIIPSTVLAYNDEYADCLADIGFVQNEYVVTSSMSVNSPFQLFTPTIFVGGGISNERKVLGTPIRFSISNVGQNANTIIIRDLGTSPPNRGPGAQNPGIRTMFHARLSYPANGAPNDTIITGTRELPGDIILSEIAPDQFQVGHYYMIAVQADVNNIQQSASAWTHQFFQVVAAPSPDNISVGVATVMVMGVGNFTGTQMLNFKNP